MGMSHVDTLRKFAIVVDDCFSIELGLNYEQHIEDFKQSYESLGASITPKVHIIFHHVAQFCNIQKKGLGFFAEQSTESVHHDFNERLIDFKVPEISENYWPKNLRAVSKYNSLHL